MSENVDNVQGNAQENSENSENIQQESETHIETPENDTSNELEGDSQGEKADSSSGDEDELALPEPDISDDEVKKKKDQPEWMKKRLEREKRKEEERVSAQAAETERLRQENLALRGVQPPVQQQQQQHAQYDPYMPQREQFNNDGEFFLALTDYREARRQQEGEFHRRQQSIKQHETEFQGKLKEAVETGKEKYKDFDERTDYILYGEGFPSNRGMAEAVVDSEYKDDILYFLGTHVKEAERIANLNPVKAAKEIAKIEVRFASRKKTNIPKAPPPLKPVTGGKGSATHGNPEKMEMDEFRQWYKDKFG